MISQTPSAARGRSLLNKVPEVTAFFWIIKVLATTVGETVADWLTGTVALSLVTAACVVGAVLVATLVLQFRLRRYTAPVYWVAVVLISVVGTLITDHLVDDLGVPLWVTTVAFALALAATFATWFTIERTLSIHSIVTRRREAFYWLAILFTFALGTAAGDLIAESLGLGYAWSVVLFAAAIAVVAGCFRLLLLLGAVTAFWAAYILTRPLGASVGDLLSQPRTDGGLGLGTSATSGIFLALIAGLVVYLAISRVDVETAHDDAPVVPQAPAVPVRVEVGE